MDASQAALLCASYLPDTPARPEARQALLSTLRAQFGASLADEGTAFPVLSALVQSIEPGRETRSGGAKKRKREELELDRPKELKRTPLDELTLVEDDEVLWAQLELRHKPLVDLIKTVLSEDAVDPEQEDGAGSESGSDGELEDELLDSEDDSEDDMMDDDDDELSEPDTTGSSPGPLEPHYFKPLELPSSPVQPVAALPTTSKAKSKKPKKEATPVKKSAKKHAELDDDFFSLDEFNKTSLALEDSDASSDDGSELDLFSAPGTVRVDSDEEADDFDALGLGVDEDEEEEEEDEMEQDRERIMYKDFFAPPARHGTRGPQHGGNNKKGKGRSPGRGPEDGEETPKRSMIRSDAPEPSSVFRGTQTPGRPTEDEDEEDEDEEEEPSQPSAKKRKVSFHSQVKVQPIPLVSSARSNLAALKAAMAERKARLEAGADGEEMDEDDLALEAADDLEDEDLEDDDDDDEEDGSDDEENEEEEEEGSEDASEEEEEGAPKDDVKKGAKTIERFKTSLFEDDESEDGSAAGDEAQSRHSQRQTELLAQIRALEQENVAPKAWATRGEVRSKDRPQNSLLEEDLEFERRAKMAPLGETEEGKSLEDRIKARIVEGRYDDVVRRRPFDATSSEYLPSRYLALSDAKSQKSLAEIYEDSYKTAVSGSSVSVDGQAVNDALAAQHKEIEDLYAELSGAFDALSNARFTPRAPKLSIETISTSAPSASLESALPIAVGTSTLLAPEEVYAPPTAAQEKKKDKSDLTPEEKLALRKREKRERRRMAERVARKEEKESSGKEKAYKALEGKRGVTVLGKGKKDKDGIPTAAGKEKKKGSRPEKVESSSSVKL